jgi:hypothetical protein
LIIDNPFVIAVICAIAVGIAIVFIQGRVSRRTQHVFLIMDGANEVVASMNDVRAKRIVDITKQSDMGAFIHNVGSGELRRVRGELRMPDGSIKYHFDCETVPAHGFAAEQWPKDREDSPATFEYERKRRFNGVLVVTFLDELGNHWQTLSDKGSPCLLVYSPWSVRPFLWIGHGRDSANQYRSTAERG